MTATPEQTRMQMLASRPCEQALAAVFGGLSATVRGLEDCFQPQPEEYASVLQAGGFAILEMRRGGHRFFLVARRRQ